MFEQQLHEFMQNQSSLILVVILVIAIILLAKGADMVVSSAVALALRWKLPKVVVGATVVSLGTTLPETMISVLAAVKGDPGLALGNAVGSIICDTGLILGIAATISPLPLNRSVVNRQGWLQLGAGFLLVIACIPWSSPAAALTTGGGLSRVAGMLFLVLLVAYILLTIRWSRSSGGEEHLEGEEDANAALPGVILRLIVGLSLVIVSSHLLIPAAQILAAVVSSSHLSAQPNDSMGHGIPDMRIAFAALDVNGSATWQSSENALLLFPNPAASGVLRWLSETPHVPDQWRLFGLSGQVKAEGIINDWSTDQGERQGWVDLGKQIPAGHYIFQLLQAGVPLASASWVLAPQ